MPEPYEEEITKRFTDPELRKRVLAIRSSILMASDIVTALSASFDDLMRMNSAAWAEKMSDEIATASDFFQRLELQMLKDKQFLGAWGRECRWSKEDAHAETIEPPEPPNPEMIARELPTEEPRKESPLTKMANLFRKEGEQ